MRAIRIRATHILDDLVNSIYDPNSHGLYWGTRQSLAHDLSNLASQFANHTDIVC